MKTLVLTLLTLCVFSQTAYSDSDMTSSLTVDTMLTFKWKISDDGTSIDFGCIFKRKSWFGIAFNGVMSGADMVLVELTSDGKSVTTTDYFNELNTRSPVKDATQDVTLVSSTVADAQISVRFSRKLNTSDTKDKLLVKGDKYTFAYASSDTPTMTLHTKFMAFEVAKLDNNQTPTDEDSNGTIMTLGLMLLMVLV